MGGRRGSGKSSKKNIFHDKDISGKVFSKCKKEASQEKQTSKRDRKGKIDNSIYLRDDKLSA